MTTRRGEPCDVPDCDQPAKSRGWCVKHYARWLRHGTTELKGRTRFGDVARIAAADVVMALAAERMLVAPPEEVCALLGITPADLRAALARRTRATSLRLRDRIGPNRDAPPGQKWCAKCKRFRLLAAFNRASKCGDGRQRYCASCHAEYMREWRQKAS